MAEEYKRHPTLSTAPVPASKPATVGDVITAIHDHRDDCVEKQAEARRPMWGQITEVKLSLERIESRFKLGIWIITVAVGLAGAVATIGVFVARYAIVGAITEQLDKRLPPLRVVEAPHSSRPLFSSAQAAESRP